MHKYRNGLPQLRGDFFMTDGGIETTLIFLDGQELPLFAAFHLLKTAEGENALRKYLLTYAELAQRYGVGLILESPTWRSSPDWGAQLGYSPEKLVTINKKCICMLEDIRRDFETNRTPIVISGCIGPRGDGYVPDTLMSAQDAASYHSTQIESFADSAADLVTAITMNYAEEAIGITLAAKEAQIPVVVSFTLETDGRLPTGQSLSDAISQVDNASSGYPAYFMINCAHPSHFDKVLKADDPVIQRIHGLRANASTMSHTELNEAPELDAGNPDALGAEYAALKKNLLPNLNVMGGCCGTDHRHIEKITLACLPAFQAK